MLEVRSAGLTRRQLIVGGAWLAAIVAGCGAPAAGGSLPPSFSTLEPTGAPGLAAPIPQPSMPGPAAFAAYAADLRRAAVEAGDQAFGAVVVRGNSVVGLGPSRVVAFRDATAHAEMEAIRDASRRLGTADLGDCDLYSTSRPCPMCEAAASWARIRRMLTGDAATDAGAPSLCR